jgi:hypothetical protein
MTDEPGIIEAVRREREAYSSGGGIKALTESVRLGRAALSAGGPLQGSAALELGASLGLLYGATGELRHLEESQASFEQAVSLLPAGHPDLAAVYTNIAANLVQRFQRLGRPEDLAAAGAAARQGIGTSMPGDPDLAGRYTNLGEVLRLLYHATGDPKVLDESIEAGRNGIAELKASTHAAPMVLASVAAGLYLRGLTASSTGDLKESIALARQAAAASAPGSVWGQNAGSILAAALRARFELTGEVSCLSEAIVLHRENADRISVQQPEYATHLLQLAASLLARYERQGDRLDLDAADVAASKARRSENALSTAEAWSLAGICRRYRAENLAADGDQAAAELAAQEAVDASARALSQPAVAGGQEPDYRIRHCNALAARYELTGNRTHRAEAADAYRAVIDGLGGESPAGQLAMLNLGIVLLRHEPHRPADEADVSEAQLHFRNLLSASASVPGGRLWTAAVLGLIRAIAQLFAVAPQDVDVGELEALYRQVTAVRAVPPRRRAAAGMLAGRVLMQAGRAEAASWILTDAVQQLPAVAWRGAHRGTRESQLEDFSELGGDAAASHLLAGGDAPDAALRAAEAVEQGRAVLWADMLQLRREDESVQRSQPGLVARLRELAAALDVPDELQADGLGESRGVDRRMTLAVEWDEVISEVRREAPGFLEPPDLAAQLPAAGHGPVIIFNVSSVRCDALVVTAAGVRAVPLPSLSATDISRQTNRYLDAYERLAPTGKRRVSTATAESPDEVLSGVLEWLWDTAVGPVLSAIGIDAPPQPGQPLPHLWWCPTGLLSLLPLHAAGYHDPVPSGSVPRTVLDRAVSSYTPTLGALAAARRAQQPGGGDGDLLFVGLPETPGEDQLASASRDRDVVTSSMGAHCHDLYSQDATVAAVRSKLPSYPWVHFSCHAEQNLAAPSTGGLKLWDGTLTLADLSAQGLAGEFAFLAACQTATGGSTLPNEAISLAAALHFAGYRRVVATLSPVYENAAAQVAEMLYRDLVSQAQLAPARAARALHAAALNLRDTDRTSPSWWTPFIHIGP